MKPCDVKHKNHLLLLKKHYLNLGYGHGIVATPIGAMLTIGDVQISIDQRAFRVMAEWYLKDQVE